MKWLLMIVVVLLVPVSVQAQHSGVGADVVIIGQKWDEKRPHELKFFLAVDEDGNYIRATIRLYMPKKYPRNALPKGQCRLFVNNQLIPDLEDYLIFGENGRDLWLANLNQRDRVTLSIMLGNKRYVGYISVAIESNKGTGTGIWKSASAEMFFTRNTVEEGKKHYRELSLDDVCGEFSGQEFLKSS